MGRRLKERKEHIHPSFWELFLSLPKSIHVNFKLLKFNQAIKLPILVSHKTKLIGVNKKSLIINLPQKARFGCCRIGLSGSESGYLIPKKSLVVIRNGGKIVLNGIFGFGRGLFLFCDKGTITIGYEFKANYNAHIACQNSSISIGEKCSLGWDCTIKSYDGHFVIVDGQKKSDYGDITIGNHCWICSKATVLKNGFLGNDCILSYNSLLTKKVDERNGLLYAGQPAKVIKEKVNWEI